MGQKGDLTWEKKRELTTEEIVAIFNAEHGRQFGEHFIHFVIKGNKFDFNAFRSQDEFDQYLKDMEIFGAGEVKKRSTKKGDA